jgi:hypothetical protein
MEQRTSLGISGEGISDEGQGDKTHLMQVLLLCLALGCRHAIGHDASGLAGIHPGVRARVGGGLPAPFALPLVLRRQVGLVLDTWGSNPRPWHKNHR